MYYCKECNESASNCIICKIEEGRKTTPYDCTCKDGYYEDSVTKNCIKCPSNCNTCTDGSGNCTSCSNDRPVLDVNDPTCGCASTSFENPDGSCTACISPCMECSNL